MTNDIGQFCRFPSPHSLELVREHADWKRDWHTILPLWLGGTSHHDLFFYGRNDGVAKFFRSDGKGGLSLVREAKGLRKTWDIIVRRDFRGSGASGLLFYDRAAGLGRLYDVGPGGTLSLAREYSDMQSTWDLIIPVEDIGLHFHCLLFYDRTNGEAKLCAVGLDGDLKLVAHYTGWNRHWDIIVAGDIPDSPLVTYLFFYRRVDGEAKLIGVGPDAELFTKQHFSGWHPYWDVILPGDFSSYGGKHDLLLYDRDEGRAEIISFDSKGNATKRAEFKHWQRSWSHIIAGRFVDSTKDSLLFYKNQYRLKVRFICCADDNEGRRAKTTADQVRQWVDVANRVYAGAGVFLEYDVKSDFHEMKYTSLNDLEKGNEAAKEVATKVASAYPEEVVFFSTWGKADSAMGGGMSSGEANYVSLPGFDSTSSVFYYKDGTSKKKQHIKLLAHELGHYLGLDHTHGSIDSVKSDFHYDDATDPEVTVLDWMREYDKRTMTDIDADHDTVPDTPPDVKEKFFLTKGWSPADRSKVIAIESNEDDIDLTFSPDRHNVMSYFGCDDYNSLTAGQVRRIRAFLHTDARKKLIEGQ